MHDVNLSHPLDADIIVAGAGIGGISAALGAARSGARVILLDQAPAIGGTGIHSPVGLICEFWDHQRRPINTGIHRELFPWVYPENGGRPWDEVPTYDEKQLFERYCQLLAAEPFIQVLAGKEVASIARQGHRISSIQTADGTAFSAKVYIDATGNGNFSALAGARYEKGRKSDGKMQPATLTFKVAGLDKSALGIADIKTWDGIRSLRAELLPYYSQLKATGGTSNQRDNVLCFPYPDGESILFNQTRIVGVDPSDPVSVNNGRNEGEKQLREFFGAIRQHPAFHNARIESISLELGIREGRRVMGDYVLTATDCLHATKFDDMVAACAYSLDIHSPDGVGTQMHRIEAPGYYHIPYRALRAAGLSNLLLGSRCISGTHEAHSSYRIMASVSAIGQAAGVAAALSTRSPLANTRDIDASSIRAELRQQNQFTEEPTRLPRH